MHDLAGNLPRFLDVEIHLLTISLTRLLLGLLLHAALDLLFALLPTSDRIGARHGVEVGVDRVILPGASS